MLEPKSISRMAATFGVVAATAGVAQQGEEIGIGVLLGFTGPIESLAAPMGTVVKLVTQEATESGVFLGGASVTSYLADTACTDNALAVASAERLLAAGVAGLIGGACSGATAAVLKNVAIPNGMVMISPGASSPNLSVMEDKGLFFRTVAPDDREGQVMADVLIDRGIRSIALTYANNDYGVGMSDAIVSAFEAAGGEVTINAAHEDGKADYSADVAVLAAAGGEVLVVAGYIDQGGLGIVRTALDLGAFDTFGLPSTMVGQSLVESVGPGLEGSFGQVAGNESQGLAMLAERAGDEVDGTLPYVAEVYDATALMILAMQAADSADPAHYGPKIWDVANAPGVKIFPGELARGLKLLAEGVEIDYVGGSEVELIGPGESAGSFREVEVRDGTFVTIGYR
ncbi:ABC transporter substrate-binding protein [Aliiruegeria lutimaris]|uniref:Amino acid/amide ABC transporter substrate-binding protein, HAAT family (TC 3.A.1.4.-) n=1 Tax=Aliiruegeria lutimaris TaxID=571298 RepID=A0A1G9J9Z2_9RHOB|nr:amino acid/amide ABC transporter substrate-binding protein, HAAT family (TC 3.A.1.4.-) [Aliiruegeria lutimaris]